MIVLEGITDDDDDDNATNDPQSTKDSINKGSMDDVSHLSDPVEEY